jgi:hypothetical protein
MKSAYVLASCFYSVAMTGGGAVLAANTGNYWWLVGGFCLSLVQGHALSARLDKWQR